MTVSNNRFFAARNFILPVYCLIIFGVAMYSLKNPAYNWDLLPYMGVELSYDKIDANNIHTEVYATAKEQVPPIFYNRMIDPANKYRNSVAQSPDVFQSQLPFYIVKPFYTRMAWLFYKAGFSVVLSTVLPSVIAYCIIGLLLFYWFKKYWSEVYACIGAALIMLSPPLLGVAGLSTPDAVSGLLLFAAIYFFTEKKSINAGFVLLVLSIFARLDNILPAIIFLSIVCLTGKFGNKIPALKSTVLFSVLLLTYFAVSANTSVFGWSIFFYPAFVKHLNVSYSAGTEFNLHDYITLAKAQLTTGVLFSFISLFFFLVALLLWNVSLLNFSKLSLEQTLAIVFVLIIVIRFILQPLIADRIYVPYYLSVLAFLVKQNSLAVRRQ